MKKGVRNFIAGVLVGVNAMSCISAMAGHSNMIEAFYNNIKIVVDGKRIHPDSEPFISNGKTYLPVRDVAEAVGKAVYWDGPNYTVYLGNGGILEYPTVELSDVDNIGDRFYDVKSDKLTDNYGNSYSYATYSNSNSCRTFETLLNMKYSKFKCTLYVPKGCTSSRTAKILIKTDGKTVYTSPEITKTSRPIPVEVDIRGCNNFQIEVTDGYDLGYIADGGFYQ